MRRSLAAAFVALLLALSASAARAADFLALATRCAPHVDAHTLAALVSVESGYNPYAIGVVGAHLVRQPVSLEEALATVDNLTRLGYNFSLGLGQVNRYNLTRFGETTTSIFDPCANLRVAGSILTECFARAVRIEADEQYALRKALSCYYSGNFSTGFTAGYVERVVSHALDDGHHEVAPIPLAPGGAAPSAAAPSSSQPPRAHAVAARVRSTHPSRCAPGIVVLSDCASDGLPHGGTVKILR
ncbi:lytic transglycosylase domain-containing protein [Trinickia acidisoli]|uniref:lytic transglycosylase domain-containing protein n=1 Tax=Trinickia acidisoli TaxID=2767482 RepID=UPI001A8EF826|nr:lytic transglycosylase domain-containing protein [Trinickia acidisoli]